MPRPADPGTQAHQRRQRRYRARLAGAGRPEMSAVDVACAEALAAFAADACESGDAEAASPFLRLVLKDAVSRLVEKGFDPRHARLQTVRRLARFDSRTASRLERRRHRAVS